MALEIFWTQKALDSYEQISDYLSENFGSRTEKTFDDLVAETLKNISNFPEMFRAVEDKR